jgi:hypothetical protein
MAFFVMTSSTASLIIEAIIAAIIPEITDIIATKNA